MGLLLLRVSASSSRSVSPSHFVFSTIVVDDGRNRYREVVGLFTDHLIRKHFPDQVDPEDAYRSSDS